ncbi:Sigma-54-dependent Fis family transcriptional regulator [Sulfidibacter corallicola]|uniref:Sigma-54-dependent Fis family transcriptional regulator n=1 Tax=Sulfidibacter corallicola TaxID=2818388 RepID=A0A8A4TU98_SULCO|nr:sigma-54 dependent transcriptional regulator [Sulfidibacter corallicola]QTD50105.1 sigma-54-dependent Fis family transcriptional regulator [Sulfidibacter corallicola]
MDVWEDLDDVTTFPGRHSRAKNEQRELVPTLTIINHPIMSRIGEVADLPALKGAGEVGLSRVSPDFAPPGQSGGFPLKDPFISRQPVYLRAARGTVTIEGNDLATELWINGHPMTGSRSFRTEALFEGVTLQLGERVVLLLHLREASAPQPQKLGMCGESDAINRVRGAIERIAERDVPVLIRGETGTGKELVARAIFALSSRAKRPFVTVNLGALPPNLAVSELFGAVKGSFTGAVHGRQGYFRAAHGGVLFLDEIGEADAEIQVMLLRALESGEIQPLGQHTPLRVDVRLIAATDADLAERVAAGTFKEPLLHRLAGYEIHLPPLHRRRDDIARLIRLFAEEELSKTNELHHMSGWDPRKPAWLPADLCTRLTRYRWPGNVRQLRNVVRQLVIDSRGLETMVVSDKLRRMLADDTAENGAGQDAQALRLPSEIDESQLVAALKANRWEPKATADALRINRTAVYALIARCESVRTAMDLTAEEIRTSWKNHGGDQQAMVDDLCVSERGLRRRLKQMKLI